jgi:hypothetical protein
MTCANRIFLALAIAALPSLALAQPRTGDTSVAAETLFREGKRLMKDGKLAEACDKLAASDRIEESVGTLLNLADCREKNGQLATAWAMFLRAASIARTGGDGGREAEARKRASALETQLAYLTISVPQASHVDGLIIKRDGEPIDVALWNQGVPVDVGSYEISGQAPGHEQWSTRVQIAANGARTSVEVPRFKQLKDLAPPPATPLATPAAPSNDGDDDERRPAPHATMFTRRRIAALASAGVGVAGIVGGVGFGLAATHLQHESDAICPASNCGDAHALDLNKRAQRDALASEVSFAIGGAAVAGAAVLWVIGAPTHVTETVGVAPVIGNGRIGLAYGRAF